MNVRPKNYRWPTFYEHLIDVTKYTFSWRATLNRYRAVKPGLSRWMNVLRAMSAQGPLGRIKCYTEMHRRLHTDRKFRDFFEQETTDIPQFYVNWIRQDLGPLWEWLPKGALHHDPHAYLQSEHAQRTQMAATAHHEVQRAAAASHQASP
jgi:hypothetical protein